MNESRPKTVAEQLAESSSRERLRGLRPPKPARDPWRPIDIVLEDEPFGPVRTVPDDQQLRRWLTVFLTGAECPFTCVFCDLWQYTLEGSTPAGAIPQQIRQALATEGAAAASGIKLYNASNYFDERAVPAADDGEIAELLARFEVVAVESHPRLIGARTEKFAEQLTNLSAGRSRLEVALGLEVADDTILQRLNKQMSMADFQHACRWLSQRQIGIRAFVLLGAPFVPEAERLPMVMQSIATAFDHGAAIVSVIPVRHGSGELARLSANGEWSPPSLAEIETVMESVHSRSWSGRVLLDLWDLEHRIDCSTCGSRRLERLAAMQLSVGVEPPIDCADCSGSAGDTSSPGDRRHLPGNRTAG